MDQGILSNSNSLREYMESGSKYSYHTSFREIENRYCIITYPDGTTLKTNNVETVYNHLKLHRKLLNISRRCTELGFSYPEEYNKYFSSFKRISINSLNNVNREKITIKELLNDV